MSIRMTLSPNAVLTCYHSYIYNNSIEDVINFNALFNWHEISSCRLEQFYLDIHTKFPGRIPPESAGPIIERIFPLLSQIKSVLLLL